MEEFKNNAVEKAENAADTASSLPETPKKSTPTRKPVKSVKSAKSGKKSVKKDKSVKTDKAHKKAVKKRASAIKKAEKQKLREKKTAEIEVKKAEKEKIRAEKRVELARIKAEKKAEQEKAKQTAIREKNKRKADLKLKKQQAKEQKAQRKDTLKRETKAQRERRIKQEKTAKAQYKKQKRTEKAELKRQKLEDKQSRKRQRTEYKQKRNSSKKSGGFGGWLAAVISLGVATLVLASLLTVNFFVPTANDNALEATYQKSFYDTVEQVENIDLNLSKALASNDSQALQTYLVDTAINSELAENDLQQLPIMDESKYYTTKLVNQIGDYAKYLNEKLINGETLTSEDRDNLSALYQANLQFKNSLSQIMEEMGTDYSFSSLQNGGSGDIVLKNFNELQNLSVTYPSLIYDGPFSDGQQDREIKGLSGDEITSAEAQDIFKSIFGEYGIDKVESVGETGGSMECYNVQATVNGNALYAQISKIQGELIMFNYNDDCSKKSIDEDYAVEKALEFLDKIGLSSMREVWTNLSNNVYTINFAFEDDGVIIYPDLVKVRVCAESAKVIGLEAKSYYTNHTERQIASPTVSVTAAKAKVYDKVEIASTRLCVVPIGTSSETLAYEFMGTLEGDTYYVYIGALSGKQVEMFKVISSSEGSLLM